MSFYKNIGVIPEYDEYDFAKNEYLCNLPIGTTFKLLTGIEDRKIIIEEAHFSKYTGESIFFNCPKCPMKYICSHIAPALCVCRNDQKKVIFKYLKD